MGQSASNTMPSVLRKKFRTILLVGLDGSGKGNILHRIKHDKFLGDTMSTVGYNIDTIEFNGISFVVWDMGGIKGDVRNLWNYHNNKNFIIFVVDSTDPKRLYDPDSKDNARFELNKLLKDNRDSRLLVYHNKADIGKTTLQVACEELKLNMLRNRRWYIQSCSCKTGDGVLDGFGWITNIVKREKINSFVQKTTWRSQNYQTKVWSQFVPLSCFIKSNSQNDLVDSIFSLLPTIVSFLSKESFSFTKNRKGVSISILPQLQSLSKTNFFQKYNSANNNSAHFTTTTTTTTIANFQQM